jgi:hypothetical protein
MHFANTDMTQVMGIGSYVGEIRRGPDGQIYQWVEGVDGLGNPIGFWKAIKKVVGKVVSKAAPLVKFIPGIGPVIDQVRGAVKGFCRGLPTLKPVVQQSPSIKPVYKIGTKICNILGKVGLAEVEDGLVQAPDGQLYEVVEGIGEFGQVNQYLRPVWMKIPVMIEPRGPQQSFRRTLPVQPAVRRRVVRPRRVAPVRRVR